MVAFALLPSLLVSFTVGHSRVALSKVRAPVRNPAPVAFQADESFTSMINRLEKNVIGAESDWETAVDDARLWLEAPLARLDSLDSLLPVASVVDSSRVSLTDGDDSYTVTVAGLHGVDAVDCEVSVDDRGMLQIEGETTVRTSGGLRRSSFRRSLPIPADADSDVMSTTRVDDALIVVLPKTGGAPSLGDDLLAETAAEAEDLAAKSPRFARWLKAHGYLSEEATTHEDDSGVLSEMGEQAPSVGDELFAEADAEAEKAAAKSPHFVRWLKAHGDLVEQDRNVEEEEPHEAL